MFRLPVLGLVQANLKIYNSALLALCKWNPSTTGGLSSQTTDSNVKTFLYHGVITHPITVGRLIQVDFLVSVFTSPSSMKSNLFDRDIYEMTQNIGTYLSVFSIKFGVHSPTNFQIIAVHYI